MTSCPVCYEVFSNDKDETSPRRLNCGDIVCSSCILSELIDEVFYCPECGEEHKGANLSDFSASTEVAPLVDETTSDATSEEVSLHSSSDESEVSPRRTVSRVASISRTPCTEPGCKNKAIAHGLCLKHSKNVGSSVFEAEKIANDMLINHDLRFFSSSAKSLRKDVSDFGDYTNPEILENKFKNQQRIELGEAMDLIMRCKAILSKEPNILRLEAPVIVVGDIHGQYFDLLNIFQEGGKTGLTDNSTSYLFLGDYVDRGYYSCEVMLHLISLKIAHPDRFWLLRGNHECSSISGHFGFKEECKMKYGVNTYYSFLLLFQTMPIAATISTAFGDIFACHGGLSPNLVKIEDIELIDRFVEPEGNLSLMDMLWSDPISDGNVDDMTAEEYQDFLNLDWRPNPARGCSYTFGYKAVKTFLQKNSLVCLVRAHEVQEEGFRQHFAPDLMENKLLSLKKLINKKKPEENPKPFSSSPRAASLTSIFDEISTSPKQSPGPLKRGVSLGQINIKDSDFQDLSPVITVFSAPNYCGRYQNKGAILLIESALDSFRVIQYDCVEHPKPEIVESETKNLIQVIIETCPYMPTSFRTLVKLAVELGPDESVVEEEGTSPLSHEEKTPESSAVVEEVESVKVKALVTAGSSGALASPEGETPRLSGGKPTKRRGSVTIPLVRQSSAVLGSTTAAVGSSSSAAINALNNSGGNSDSESDMDESVYLEEGSPPKPSVTWRDMDSRSEEVSPVEDRRPFLGKTFSNSSMTGLEEQGEFGPIISPGRRLSMEVRRSLMTEIAAQPPREEKKKASNIYLQALATDSINEYHPDFMTKNFKNLHREEYRSAFFKLSNEEKPKISVSELKNRFERFGSEHAMDWAAGDKEKRKKREIPDNHRCSEIHTLLDKFGGAGKSKVSSLRLPKNIASRLFSSSSGKKEKEKKTEEKKVLNRSVSMLIDKTEDTDEFAKKYGLKSDLKKTNRISLSSHSSITMKSNSHDLDSPSKRENSYSADGERDLDGFLREEEFSVTSRDSDFDEIGQESPSDRTGVKDSILFSQAEIMGLRLMFSLFDRTGSNTITYEDLVAYAEETGDVMAIRDAAMALEVLDLDGDGTIGLLDFIHFSRRLKKIHLDSAIDMDQDEVHSDSDQ